MFVHHYGSHTQAWLRAWGRETERDLLSLHTTHYILHTTYTEAGGFLFQASESQFSLLVPLIPIIPTVKNFKPRNAEGASLIAGTPFTSIPRWWHCSTCRGVTFTHLSLDTRDPGPRSLACISSSEETHLLNNYRSATC